MSRTNTVSYDQWVQHLYHEFSRSAGHFEIGYPDDWYANPRMLVEHYTQFLENSVPVVDRFGRELVGEMLWGLTSSVSDLCIEVCDQKIPVEIRNRAISAIGTMIRELVPRHLTRGLWESWNKLDCTVFMYWDIASVWPATGTDEGRALLQVCLDEMRSVLELDHPVAQLHALHGLGEFHISFASQTAPIVDAWIAAHPHANPEIMEYAQHARDGLVQ